MLSDAQVALIHRRRKALGLTIGDLHARFADALRARGCVHVANSAKMRLDRVLNPKMRRPVTEVTQSALAQALGWSLDDFEETIYRRLSKASPDELESREETARRGEDELAGRGRRGTPKGRHQPPK
jgi:hypothetical protein